MEMNLSRKMVHVSICHLTALITSKDVKSITNTDLQILDSKYVIQMLHDPVDAEHPSKPKAKKEPMIQPMNVNKII